MQWPDFLTALDIVKLSESCSIYRYNCTNTASYNCEDTAGWPFDFNKLWGRARCGYLHDHHQDSDRFFFRRCSDGSCNSYNGTNTIQIAAYSYDNGVKPYTGEDTGLLKVFANTLLPETYYQLQLSMDSNGKSTFTLYSYDKATEDAVVIETQYVYHKTLCTKNYFEGTVQGLYNGGTCEAPLEIAVEYVAV